MRVSSRELRTTSAVELRRLIESCISTAVPDDSTPFNIAGITPEQHALVQHLLPVQRTQAAVLVPIVVRPEGLMLLFTQRAEHLRRHAGQISFPGGRIEPSDAGPMAAALRETEEEIGLSRSYIHTVGYLAPQLIFTGYYVTPVIGFVQPGFELFIDTSEVAEVFEAPLNHFLDPANHLLRDRELGVVIAKVYDIPYGDRRVWGATAGIIMSLYRLLKAQEPS